MRNYDYSTLNLDALSKLPVAKLAPTYRLQDDPGNGCFLDPPGYPTYFTQSVYTRHGNNPGRGATMVIRHPETGALHVVETANWYGETWEKHAEQLRKLFRSLYVPLPIEHPRVQGWLTATFAHFRGCYVDVERPEYGRPGTLIYPVPSYKLKHFHDDARWSEEYRTSAKAEVEAFNKQERDRAARVATVSNHQAVRIVREIYPDFQPPLDENFLPVWHGTAARADWWERHAERPTPDACVPPQWFGPHRAEGWCQFCGHVGEKS